MKAKLTLSVSEPTVHLARRIAKARKTTVSNLFQEAIADWAKADQAVDREKASGRFPTSDSLLGALETRPVFDARSARIREKHG